MLGDNEIIHIKIAVTEGAINDFAAYVAPGHWQDQDVLSSGHKLSRDSAQNLLQDLLLMGLSCKDWNRLTWRH